MTKMTQEMITECYEAFRAGNKNFVPNGMNQSSAKMTMSWLDSLIDTFKPYNRSCSLMQCYLVLEKIRQDYGAEKAQKAAESLMPYCLENNRQSHISILNRFINPVSSYEQLKLVFKP